LYIKKKWQQLKENIIEMDLLNQRSLLMIIKEKEIIKNIMKMDKYTKYVIILMIKEKVRN
jgi:hypothetical protein